MIMFAYANIIKMCVCVCVAQYNVKRYNLERQNDGNAQDFNTLLKITGQNCL